MSERCCCSRERLCVCAACCMVVVPLCFFCFFLVFSAGVLLLFFLGDSDYRFVCGRIARCMCGWFGHLSVVLGAFTGPCDKVMSIALFLAVVLVCLCAGSVSCYECFWRRWSSKRQRGCRAACEDGPIWFCWFCWTFVCPACNIGSTAGRLVFRAFLVFLVSGLACCPGTNETVVVRIARANSFPFALVVCGAFVQAMSCQAAFLRGLLWYVPVCQTSAIFSTV